MLRRDGVHMTVSSLNDYSSLVRNIGGECAFVRVSGELLLSGSKSGEVACWDLNSGKEMWRSKFEGPCSNADSNKDFLFFTESDRVHAIMLSSGDEAWCVELEGSSDLVRVSSECVWVTSSVYNFEIQDYSDGSVWKIDYSGKVRWKGDTIGRAWSLSDFQGQAIMGLSRPKCGYAIASETGIEYLELEEKKPITAGCKLDGGGIVFGHSNGSVTEIYGGVSSTVSLGDSAIRAMDCGSSWVVGLDSGVVSTGKSLGSWKIESLESIDVVSFGPSLDDVAGIWYSSWNDKGGIFLVDSSIGSLQLELSHESRIVACFATEHTICFGDISGCIHVIEEEVLRRRFGRLPETDIESGRESELRKKIRALRGA
ncbi:MAG TPA: hypothetical protein D7H77_01880 [Candidatus Poseidoniales archaeon]|nr:MAG TPA: hypothetical protein D7H77_01880 [Candidatus Poseidoniales archaeon]HIH67117.1 PQQ-binding-like beta-propeller repeat protein [Candidatus Thalassarchaeaceae archaeon]